jgi:hypothetical protein
MFLYSRVTKPLLAGCCGDVIGRTLTVSAEPLEASMAWAEELRIAAIVPCHNEEIAVARVVADLRASVAGITVYVYDNCSTDRTVERARCAGAIVRSEPSKGKGNVVRRAFADVDADVYLLIDGDDTYDAAAAPAMIRTLLENNLDQVLGVRREANGANAYRPAHAAGNRALNKMVTAIFGDTRGDMLSGFRVLSRRFVKSFPAVSREFEIETELTVHSLALRIPTASVPVDFRDRAAGSASKLRTFRDGWKILNLILRLARHERPVAYFGLNAAMLAVMGTAIAGRALIRADEPALSTLFMAAFLLMSSVLLLVTGVVLDGVRKSRHELSRLSYMRHPAVAAAERIRDAHVVVPRPSPDPAPQPVTASRPRREESPAFAFPPQRHSELSVSPT